MINRIKVFIVLFLSLFLIGCSIKNDTTLTISENHKMDYSILISIDKGFLSNFADVNLINKEEELENYINDNIDDNYLAGFEKEKYSDDKNIGKLYKYTVDNLDTITSSDENAVQINDAVVNKLLFYKKSDTYYANFKYDLKTKEDYKDVDFKTTFTVNLPSSCVYSNADKTLNNGKTLIWNITNGKVKNIKFAFRFRGKKGYISIACIIFSLVIISLLIYSIFKGDKKS
jgi:hypothetical protein